MKKLLIALLALGTLSFVPAEAGSRVKGNCAVKKSCNKPCAKPACTTRVEKQIVQRPCKKYVLATGTCDFEQCKTITECVTDSERCISGCRASCDNAADNSDDSMSNE